LQFIDEARIEVRSGAGGAGCGSLLREKYRPKGGPDGGDGGRGGSVICVADENFNTLVNFRHRQHYWAEHGQPGRSKQANGRSGQDCVIRVPVGTIIIDDESEEHIADLSQSGIQQVVARGGRGGRGNMHFATSTNQAPRDVEQGGPAVTRMLRLKLKLLADAGLVGFPNAGKSTLIRRLSAAKPKVADYPFTTLVPNLGVVRLDDVRSFVLADIPGLIPGASEGAGLGHRFLRHVERVSVLVFLLAAEEDRVPLDDYQVLLRELEAYSPSMLEKPRLIAVNKMDLHPEVGFTDAIRARATEEGSAYFEISAVAGTGLEALTQAIWRVMRPSPSTEVVARL
jgi:GTPase